MTPEILFHRYFQTLRPPDRERYRGKHDLSGLELGILLSDVQEVLNNELQDQEWSTRGHVECPPFHFDYVDSTVSNALAFRHAGYSFIGITIPLVDQLWDTCTVLSRSEELCTALSIRFGDEVCEGLRVVLFRSVLFFVVLHEWTHHVHGHILDLDPAFPSEVLDGSVLGDIEGQALEVDADGYAVYHLLANLYDSVSQSALELLQFEECLVEQQEETLLSCFVLAICAFLFVGSPVQIGNANVYKLSHPPQSTRMSSIMKWAMSWCVHNRRGLDERWMGKGLFIQLTGIAARTIWAVTGGTDWTNQVAFLRSPDGIEYRRRLDDRVNALLRRLAGGSQLD